uniref:Uncharacterized protein n=1 Tax=Plectus sambesii TaxID=2011161 RepID=A0A914VAK1_9BILA
MPEEDMPQGQASGQSGVIYEAPKRRRASVGAPAVIHSERRSRRANDGASSSSPSAPPATLWRALSVSLPSRADAESAKTRRKHEIEHEEKQLTAARHAQVRIDPPVHSLTDHHFGVCARKVCKRSGRVTLVGSLKERNGRNSLSSRADFGNMGVAAVEFEKEWIAEGGKGVFDKRETERTIESESWSPSSSTRDGAPVDRQEQLLDGYVCAALRAGRGYHLSERRLTGSGRCSRAPPRHCRVVSARDPSVRLRLGSFNPERDSVRSPDRRRQQLLLRPIGRPAPPSLAVRGRPAERDQSSPSVSPFHPLPPIDAMLNL